MTKRRYWLNVPLSAQEREWLRRLMEAEHLPATQVVRRLLWREVQALEDCQRNDTDGQKTDGV